MRGLIVGMIVLLPTIAAGQEASGTPREQYEALAAQFKAAMDTWSRTFDSAGDLDSPEAPKEARYRDWPGWAFAPRFVALAEQYPRDEAAVEALSQVIVELGRSVSENDLMLAPHYDRAVALLIRDHLDNDRVKELCRMAAKGLGPSRETLLRTAMEKSRNRDVRGMACVGLAHLLATKAEVAKSPWFDDNEKRKDPFSSFIVSRFDPGFFRYVRATRPSEAYAESWRLFERALKDYDDVVFWRSPTDPKRYESVGNVARLQQAELRLKQPQLDQKDGKTGEAKRSSP